MLLRTASHGITPTLALDFLVPRTVLCRSISRAATKDPHVSLSKGAKGLSSRTAQQPTPSSSSTHTPGAVLAQLERDVGAYDERKLAAMTTSQVEVFNSVIPQLRDAFHQRNLPKLVDLWSFLKSRNLVALLGHPQLDVCSRCVATFYQHAAPESLTEDRQGVLHHIALVCAAGGATKGLSVLMFDAVKRGQPEDALALYDQYLEHLRQKGALRDDVQDLAEPDVDEGLANEDSASSPGTVRDEILLPAVAAHALRNSFPDALQTYLQAGGRMAPSSVKWFRQYLGHDHALYLKTSLYIRRLNHASILSRPPTLMKHLGNITRDSADVALERIYSSAIEGAREPDPWVAVKPEQLGGTRVVLLPDFFWPSFVKCMFACRRTDLAEQLWNDMVELGVKPDVVMWNALLDGYGNMRSLDAVRQTWEVMQTAGVTPNALSYRAFIGALFTAGKKDEAIERFHRFEREHLKSGVPSEVLALYNTVMHGLLFSAREEEALAIKKKMETDGPKPDIVTYNTFLRYYGRKGDLKAMAQVLQQLGPAGVAADVYTFSTLLSSMIKVRKDAIQIVLNFMQKQHVEPDTTALTAIIDHQLRERTSYSFKVAMALLSQMERGDLGNARPSSITYTSVLTAINHGDWLARSTVEEYNRRIWDTMRSKPELRPNRTTYNVLLDSSLKNRSPEGLENAMRYYRDMLQQRVYTGSDTWYIMLKGLIARKQWEMAGEVVEDMRRLHYNYNATPLRTLVERISRVNGNRE
ncbi:hypothetical protein BD413DRAFT_109455 [Trametes elegans]|nr:hypothetical protein BD413DRAFT_109455 [Trametes elegans]